MGAACLSALEVKRLPELRAALVKARVIPAEYSAEGFRGRATSGPFVGTEFALKRLLPSLREDPEAVKLFTAEAELSRHLHHPNIVEVVDVGREGQSIFMVMELITNPYMNGETIRVDGGIRMPPK